MAVGPTWSLTIGSEGVWFWSSLLKQQWIGIVVSSKLRVSERSTAPCIISTSQPPADRTTFAALSQHSLTWLEAETQKSEFVLRN